MNNIKGLKINVGFLVHEEIGVDRDFSFDFPTLKLENEISLIDGSAKLNLSKTQLGLTATMQLEGEVELECSRCLDSVSHRIKSEFTELFAFRKKEVSESAILIPEDQIIDFNPIFEEYVVLAQPLNILCRPDCKGLCVVCGGNLNIEECGHTQTSVDPRLAVLKDLLTSDDENQTQDS